MNDIAKFISGFLGFILSWFITTVVLYGGWKLLGPDLIYGQQLVFGWCCLSLADLRTVRSSK